MALPQDVGPEYSAFDHEGPWSVEDVLALPEDQHQRVEVVDGTLLVSPLGVYRHQRLLFRIAMALESACPAGLEATSGINVQVASDSLLIPDFTVNTPGPHGLAVHVEDLVLVGEVVSPSTRFKDYGIKRQRYAEAGVPFYLLVDPKDDIAVATLFELEDGEYVEVARSEAGELKLDRPFPVTIELSA
ncbi:Uma2 family endonuclease [Actinosynnema sp. NPDC050436]|uniref:Uma2 family endonuclease n=1 Tax=Actinosynnema sp. NPDC050436 TaxID=3155659 RepID=UPI0033F2D367